METSSEGSILLSVLAPNLNSRNREIHGKQGIEAQFLSRFS